MRYLIPVVLATAAPSFALQNPAQVLPPGLVDAGLHGGRPQKAGGQMPGDTTPDGRLFVFYRMRPHPGSGKMVQALQVSTVDPNLIGEDGRNPTFYDPGVDQVSPWPTYGGDYAFGDMEGGEVVFWSPKTISGMASGCSPTIPIEELDVDALPLAGANSPLTIALRPLNPAEPSPPTTANPFPSDGQGQYQVDGDFRTYHLWLITVTEPIKPRQGPCESKPAWYYDPLTQYYKRDKDVVLDDGKWLGAFPLDVIVDASQAAESIHSASVGDFEWLTFPATGTSGGVSYLYAASMHGTEPSITSDGKLLLFHGDGGPNVENLQVTTYSYNATPWSMSGWTPPKSICDLHTDPAIDPDLYPLKRFPIRQPNQNGDYEIYGPGKKIRGPYPWVSKDGAFFLSMRTRSNEVSAEETAFRSGMAACGDITGGYVKLIDDVGCNATRLGGPIIFPFTGDPLFDSVRDSVSNTFFSPGLSPGLWQMFQQDAEIVPVSDASLQIPVLPVFVQRNRTYGEARFEEADGHYSLYLSCNEALREQNVFGGVTAHEPDPSRTPDTSGQSVRHVCALAGGAEFPQEAAVDSDTVRKGVGDYLFALDPASLGTIPYHENLGVKGQAILFPATGSIQVAGAVYHGNSVTVQAFVKRLDAGSQGDLDILRLSDPTTGQDQIRVEVKGDGSIEAHVTVQWPVGGSVVATLASGVGVLAPAGRYAIDQGWHHVALTFDSTDQQTRAELWLDGESVDSAFVPLSTPLGNPESMVVVGPDGGGSSETKLLMLDEVAVSDVVRTEAEIRRDAYVAPLDNGLENWPASLPSLELGLDSKDLLWPTSLTYTPAKLAFGEALFHSTKLSVDGSKACSSCHSPDHFFVSPEDADLDINGFLLELNTPTVMNAASGLRKFFDGRASLLEHAVLEPITSPDLGFARLSDAIASVATDTDLVFKHVAAFPQPMTADHLEQALEIYLRTLTSGNSEVDQFEDAPLTSNLSSDAQHGRILFHGKARCVTCHTGSTFSDGDFHNIATVKQTTTFQGRVDATGRQVDVGRLKTPSLRNIDETGPYFHDASADSLMDVVDHYNEGFLTATGVVGEPDRALFPLGLSLPEKQALVAFLEALTDRTPPD